MSKFLNMGMPLKDVVARVTANPARVIQRPDIGSLTVGAVADVTVLGVRSGTFGFVDTEGGKLTGTQKIEAELTLRAGKVVWDLNGISRPEWPQQPPAVEPLDPWPPAVKH
jgi:dihydroorotase